ncbi:hypothetical protein Droror1_Dr00019900 [Drosera rotundifolia]
MGADMPDARKVFDDMPETQGDVSWLLIRCQSEPTKTNHVFLGASEIADVVVDFAESSSDTVILENSAAYPYPSGNAPNELNSKVTKFSVEPKYGDNPPLPTKLLDYPSPYLFSVALKRYITLYKYDSSTGNPTNLYINFVSIESPVTETPKPGSKEIWFVINLTNGNHPLHIHLALFTVLDQVQLVNLTEFTNCMVKLKNATSFSYYMTQIRKAESARLKKTFPGQILVIVEKANSKTHIPDIDKKKLVDISDFYFNLSKNVAFGATSTKLQIDKKPEEEPGTLPSRSQERSQNEVASRVQVDTSSKQV